MSFKQFVLISEYDCVQAILSSYANNEAVLSIDVNKVSHVGNLFPIRFDPTKEQAKITLLLRADEADSIRDHLFSHALDQFSGRILFYVISLPAVQTYQEDQSHA